MSIKKIIVIAVAVVAVAVIGCVSLIMNSTFQTKLANSYLKDYNSKLSQLSAGLTGAEIKDVEFPFDGGIFTAESVETNYSLTGLLSNEIDIEQFSFKGAKIKLFKKEELPNKLIVGSTELESSNKNIIDKSEQKSEPAIKTKDSSKKLNLKLLLGKAEGDIEVETADGLKANIKIEAKKITTDDSLMPKSGSIKIQSKIAKDETEQKVDFSITLAPEKNGKITLKSIGEIAERRVLQAELKFSPDFADLNGNISLEANNSIIKGLLPENVPNFATKIFTEVSLKSFGKMIDAKIEAKTEIDGLGKLDSKLEKIGKCTVEIDSKIAKTGDILKIEKSKAALTQRGQVVLFAEAPKSFEFNLANSAANIDGEVLILTLNNLKPPLISEFIDNVDISGNGISARAAVSVSPKGEIKIETTSPVVLENFGVKKSGEEIVHDINARINLMATILKDMSLNANVNAAIADTANKIFAISANVARDSSGKISGKLEANGNARAVLSKTNASLGLVDKSTIVNSSLGFTVDEKIISIDSANVEIGDSKNAKMLSAKTLSKIILNTDNMDISSANEKILTAKIDKLPVAFIAPFIGKLNGKDISANLALNLKNQIWSLFGNIEAGSLYFKKDNEYLIKNLSTKADFSAEFDGKKASAKISKFNANEGIIEVLTGDAEATYDITSSELARADINISSALKALETQPICAKFVNAMSGNLKLSAKISENKIAANLEIANLSTQQGGSKIGTAKADINAEYSCDLSSMNGDIIFEMSSQLGKTNANAKLGFAKNKITVGIDGKTIVVDDLQTLASAFTPKSEAQNNSAQVASYASENTKLNTHSTNKEKKKIVRPYSKNVTTKSTLSSIDNKAFWDFGKLLEANVKLKKVLKSGQLLASDIFIMAILDEKIIELERANGSIAGGKLDCTAKISFDKSSKTPYKLTAKNASFKGFDTSKFLEGNSYKIIEGVFDTTADIESDGSNLTDLMYNANASATIKSVGSGVIRPLDKSTDAGKTAQIAGGLMKLAGAFLSKKVNETDAVAELVDYLSKIEYNSAEMSVSKKGNLITLSKCELITPDIVLDASNGTLVMDKDRQFSESSINIDAIIYAAASSKKLALFQKAQFCTEKSQTRNGYYDGPTFTIDGTVGAPKTNLMSIITSAGVGIATRLLNN